MKEVDLHIQNCRTSMRLSVDAWLRKHRSATDSQGLSKTPCSTSVEKMVEPPGALPVISDCNFHELSATGEFEASDMQQNKVHMMQNNFLPPGEATYITSVDAGEQLVNPPSPVLDEHPENGTLSRSNTKALRSTNRLVLELTQQSEKAWLSRITGSRAYEVYSTVLILANSFYIGWQTQFLADRALNSAIANKPLQTELPVELLIIQIVFLLLFSLDLIMRWAAEGFLGFWKSSEIAWNVLDLVVVCISLLDLMPELIAMVTSTQTDDSLLSNFSVLKLLRVVRVVRVAKIIRTMKFFRELRMMVFSIMGSMKSLCWVFLVLGLVFYMFGIAFTSAVTDYLKTTAMWNEETNAHLRQHFGTLNSSVLSLYMAISGGADWGFYYHDAIVLLPGIYSFLYLLFITFSVFAVVNIVTGVFVDSAMQANLVDRDIVVYEEMEDKKQYIEEMQQILLALDTDCSGTITLDELTHGLQHEKLKAYFRALKLDLSDATMLFNLLDKGNRHAIPIDDFVDGCYKLQGEATALDTKMTFLEVQTIKERFALVQSCLAELHLSVESLSRQHR